jgi:tetratricopeptide (TPR) repeat protein
MEDDPVASNVDTQHGAFMRELKRRMQLERHLYLWDGLLGKQEGYCYNVFSRETKMPVRFTFEVSDQLKDSPVALMQAIDQDPLKDPVRYLLAHRESSVLPANDFLDGLEPRIKALLETPSTRHITAPSERTLLEGLEEQRHTDRLGALQGAEAFALRIVDSLEGIEGLKPRRLLAELAASIALWATIQRTRGFRNLAVKAFVLAFPTSKASRDGWARGCCYQRAAFLLRDCGRPDLGYEFLKDAVLYFSFGDSQLNAWRCQMDCGCLLGSAGRLEDSNEAFEMALEKLPGSEWRFRAGAYQGLGINARKSGKPEEARDFLFKAARECQTRDLLLGHISWSLAKAEAELQNEKAAVKLFHEATELLGRFGCAGDVALVSLDYAEALLKQGKGGQVLSLLTKVNNWLPNLGANPILAKAFKLSVELGLTARIGLAEIQNVRGKVELACQKDPGQKSAADRNVLP